MKPLVELYSLADGLFFEDPSRWRSEDAEFDLTRRPAPAGWNRVESNGWVSLRPASLVLVGQGWKIHAAARAPDAERTVEVVAQYCFEQNLAFKFLRGPNLLQAYNLKYAPRASSGKLLAIYPSNEDELTSCLENLDALLTSMPAPHILSDLRYGDGPLYVRYGGFIERYAHTEDGERVLAMDGPDGELVPDRRRPTFSFPGWVPLPAVLADSLAARSSGARLAGYRVTEALHFSNGGGVYLAVQDSTGDQVVLKEARPYAGLSSGGSDAVDRLDREVRMLGRLAGITGVPQVRQVFGVWEHRFLAMDLVPGVTLQRWLAIHHPLIRHRASAGDRADYLRRVTVVLENLGVLLARIHSRGVVFGDLHPANVLVDEDDSVGLVDFEAASDLSEMRRQEIGYQGFSSAHRVGVDADLHALNVLRIWMLIPLTTLIGLSVGKMNDLVDVAASQFILTADFLPKVNTFCEVTAKAGGPPAETDRPGWGRPGWSWIAEVESMASAIESSATPERSDRLFPGDVEGFRHRGTGFAYGAAGVLWALDVAGRRIDDQWSDWLSRSAGHRDAGFGFFDGWSGDAFVLEQLGRVEEAIPLVARAAVVGEQSADLSFFSGLSGVALNLLHFGAITGEHGYLGRALAVGARVAQALDSGRGCGIDRPAGDLAAHRDAGTRAGLLRGWSGTALMFLRLYEATGADQWLAHAVRACHRDLDLCVVAQDGSLQVDGGFRSLPYLEIGGAGIAVVADLILGHVTDTRLREAVGPLLRGCGSVFVADSGLFNGRAGLLACLTGLRGDYDFDQIDVLIAGHVERLGWHALRYKGNVVFPGDGCTRVSMDFATGTAGVMTSVASAHKQSVLLPFLGCRG